ncbi:NAD(P)H-dependent oxidoreductase [Actinacidiphila sp. DG2A-62]|uniref:NADPH-dependent FMN reductase n=1 Tax=Actinacidiphila sp. DG2A-62 TaxID=3108821 RepID=UPI002DBBEA05|nr:NAD(P)H-dependent oxidoreductase [Actinacidiphila sp. DG2A-62]MEC3997086.1 NAD(P)H-dependent oxidoreductase [Actinacidiphila sp. DG2A-62]
MTESHRLQVIVGSTRPGRAADRVVPWVLRRAGEHERFDVELIDLRDWPLPMFQETFATVGDFSNPTYSTPIVRKWNHKIAEGDAYLFVTTEYNHSVPGELKNALDSIWISYALRNKPAAFVGYSSGPYGGVRAVEHLSHVAIESEMAPLRNSVLIGDVQQAFNDRDEPVDPVTDVALSVTLDDLAWWSDALSSARQVGELPPGSFRLFSGIAALEKQAGEVTEPAEPEPAPDDLAASAGHWARESLQ